METCSVAISPPLGCEDWVLDGTASAENASVASSVTHSINGETREIVGRRRRQWGDEGDSVKTRETVVNFKRKGGQDLENWSAAISSPLARYAAMFSCLRV